MSKELFFEKYVMADSWDDIYGVIKELQDDVINNYNMNNKAMLTLEHKAKSSSKGIEANIKIYKHATKRID